MSPSVSPVAPPVAALPPPGLSPAAVVESRAAHGRNMLPDSNDTGWLTTLKEVVLEPMFLLLLAACAVYFALGRAEEAITLVAALLLVAGISVYQSIRSNQALGALRELTQPRVQVRRDGVLSTVPVEDLVVGDAVLVEEGGRVPADGTVTAPNDFSVDEAILTGEAVPVAKAAGDPVFGRELYKVISRAKIVLNGAVDMASFDRGNMRCFEALGCGALMLSDEGKYPDGMEHQSTMLHYSSASDAVAKIEDALSNTELSRLTASRGSQLVRSHYSKSRQWSDFIQLVERL